MAKDFCSHGGRELRSQFYWYLTFRGKGCSVVRHPAEVVQFGPQPHVWRPCLRRSPGGERRVPGRTGQQTGTNERHGQGRVYSNQHNRRAAEARRGQALHDHGLPSFFATSQRTLSLPTNELSDSLTQQRTLRLSHSTLRMVS